MATQVLRLRKHHEEDPRNELERAHKIPTLEQVVASDNAVRSAFLQGGIHDPYRFLIHSTRYARVRDDLGGRRETWAETCERTIHALCKGVSCMDQDTRNTLYEAMFRMEVMPSMRVVMTAGAALDRENMCAFNCSYLAVDCVASFREVLYILSCGSGVGFSCERRYVEKLPAVANAIEESTAVMIVPDSGKGWAHSFHKYLTSLWDGKALTVDYSRIRPAGSRLRTMGGRASGPEPLKKLFSYSKELLCGAVGRKLTSIEVHDLVCMVASCIVSGGVRRSALISLSDLDDEAMRNAKSGSWWEKYPHRACANNSAVYEGKPSEDVFWSEWEALVKSKAGERGIFNREAARRQASRRGERDSDAEYGINPCGEILLKSRQTCNLSEVIVRSHDSIVALFQKVRIAAIFGTLQSRFTTYDETILSPEWRANNEAERLLGVSLTGIMDHAILSDVQQLRGGALLTAMRHLALDTNQVWASKLGINPSRATTAIKPSGTVSQLCGTSSGIHARWADYYIRRVRLDKNDPVVQFMKAELPSLDFETDAYNDTQVVFSYPMAAPPRSVITTSADPVAARANHRTMTPIQQLELWREYSSQYCDHNPSISVYVQDRMDKWAEVGSWVWNNFEHICGISFFPSNLGTYKQAPFEAITKAKYDELVAKLPSFDAINWGRLLEYERANSDALESSHRETLTCTGGACEM